jgi:hypothetical protein
VQLREKESSDILGEQTVQIRVEVPPHQTRAINETIYFDNPPQLTHYAWTYAITEIRGSGGVIGRMIRLLRMLILIVSRTNTNALVADSMNQQQHRTKFAFTVMQAT